MLSYNNITSSTSFVCTLLCFPTSPLHSCVHLKRTEWHERSESGWWDEENGGMWEVRGLGGEREICLCELQRRAGLVRRGSRRHMAPARAAFGVTGRREGERMRQQAGEMMRQTLPSTAQGRETAARRPEESPLTDTRSDCIQHRDAKQWQVPAQRKEREGRLDDEKDAVREETTRGWWNSCLFSACDLCWPQKVFGHDVCNTMYTIICVHYYQRYSMILFYFVNFVVAFEYSFSKFWMKLCHCIFYPTLKSLTDNHVFFCEFQEMSIKLKLGCLDSVIKQNITN